MTEIYKNLTLVELGREVMVLVETLLSKGTSV